MSCRPKDEPWRPMEEPWLLTVVREVLRLPDMTDQRALAARLMPILYKRCASTCRHLVNLYNPSQNRRFVDANEFSFLVAALPPGHDARPQRIWSNRRGLPRIGAHDEPELDRILATWWDALALKPVVGTAAVPIDPLEVDVPERDPGSAPSSDNVVLVGQYRALRRAPLTGKQPADHTPTSNQSPVDLLFLLVRRLPQDSHSAPPAAGHCPCAQFTDWGAEAGVPACHAARQELYTLSGVLNDLFAHAPSFLTSPDLRVPEMPVGDETEWVQPIVEQLEGLRQHLSLAETMIRRWHLLLAWSGDPGEVQRGWVLDPQYYPNDVTLNVCVPDIPVLLHTAWLVAGGVGSQREKAAQSLFMVVDDEEGEDPRTRLLTYCMLHPWHWTERNEDQADPDPFGPGDPASPLFNQDESSVSRQRRVQDLLHRSDGGRWLQEHWRDLRAEGMAPRDGWPAWQNRLENTWSGLPAMHIHGGQPFPFLKGMGRGKQCPLGPNQEFDDWRLPKETVVLPLRGLPGQMVGFGICCLSANSRLLLGSTTDWSEIDRNPVRVARMPGQGIELEFVRDVLTPELERLARSVFEATLGTIFATINAIRHVVCVTGRRKLPDAFLTNLKTLLVTGIADRSQTPLKGPGVLDLVGSGFDLINRIAGQIEVSDTLLDYLYEFGHVFGKHVVDAVQSHVRRIERSLADSRAVADPWPHFARTREIASTAARRMAAIEHVARFHSSKPAVPVLRHVSMPEALRCLGTLPGHRMWEATSYETLDQLEDLYWTRVGVLAEGVPWSPFQPLFTCMYTGLWETILETLLHNAFKHGRRRLPDGTWDPESESSLRVYISFHQKDGPSCGGRVAAVAVWGTGSGFTDQRLVRHMLGHKDCVEVGPFPADLYRDKDVALPGHEERAGIGLRILLHCLDVQAEAAKRQRRDNERLGLFLLHRHAIEGYADHLDGAWERFPELRLVAEGLAEGWQRSGAVPPGARKGEAPGVFVVVQRQERDLGFQEALAIPDEPPKGYTVAVVDRAPAGDEDLRAYDMFNATPQSTLQECLREHLPDAIIWHSAWAETSEPQVRDWFELLGKQYGDAGRTPLVWFVSASGALQDVGTGYGAYASDHPEFTSWCFDEAALAPSGEPRARWLRRRLVHWLCGRGRAELCERAWLDTLEALECWRAQEAFRIGHQQRRWMGSPGAGVDPSVAWWLRRQFVQSGCTAGTDGWARRLEKRLKQDLAKLRRPAFGG